MTPTEMRQMLDKAIDLGLKPSPQRLEELQVEIFLMSMDSSYRQLLNDRLRALS